MSKKITRTPLSDKEKQRLIDMGVISKEYKTKTYVPKEGELIGTKYEGTAPKTANLYVLQHKPNSLSNEKLLKDKKDLQNSQIWNHSSWRKDRDKYLKMIDDELYKRGAESQDDEGQYPEFESVEYSSSRKKKKKKRFSDLV